MVRSAPHYDLFCLYIWGAPVLFDRVHKGTYEEPLKKRKRIRYWASS